MVFSVFSIFFLTKLLFSAFVQCIPPPIEHSLSVQPTVCVRHFRYPISHTLMMMFSSSSALSSCCYCTRIAYTTTSNNDTYKLHNCTNYLLNNTFITSTTLHHHHHHSSNFTLQRIRASSSDSPTGADVESPAKSLRRLLESPGIHQGPACFDALSAKLVQLSGFQFCFTSGFSISAARLGLPDTGFISYGEMLDQGSQITQAVSIPVIGDGDNGYGNAMNVKRTVKGYIKAGFAGIILEDQVSPKACGHTRGRRVVSREEAVMRIKAAVDARKESGSDIVIVARTDSRQAISLDESIWRSKAFADAGADVLFIDALTSKEEMERFCEISPLVPKMANMLEGGGKTPILNPIELEDIGYKLVAYPLSLMGVSIHAMQDALAAIKGGRIPTPGSMPSFEELQEILGFNSYYEEEKRYITKESEFSSQGASSKPYIIREKAEDDKQQRNQSSQEPVVEVLTPEVYSNTSPGSSGDPFSGIWSRKLRVKIVGRDGSEKLDIRIPAGFLDGITNIVPALGGINIKALVDDAALEIGGKLLLDFTDSRGDRIQVFLE